MPRPVRRRSQAPLEGSSRFGGRVIAWGGVGPLVDRGTFTRRAGLKARAPCLLATFDRRGLFTVLADRGALRCGIASVQALRVCGHSVGPLSDPS